MLLLERLIHLLLRCARICPPRFAFWFGGQLGWLWSYLPIVDVRRCRAHLAMAYPEAAPAWHARTARRVWRHFGRMGLWTVVTMEADPRLLCRDIAVEGHDNWRSIIRACRRREGTMGMSGHFGNWELLSRSAATVVPLTVIGRRLRWAMIDRLVWHNRTAGGAHLVYQDDDIRAIIRELRAGRFVATLPDQDVPRLAGVHVPWFGRLAHTPSGPGILTQLAGGWVQPGYCYLASRGGYRWTWVSHSGPRVRFPRFADRTEGARVIMAWTMAYQEALVRRHPEQWAWWHRRWRTVARGVDPPNPSPGPFAPDPLDTSR